MKQQMKTLKSQAETEEFIKINLWAGVLIAFTNIRDWRLSNYLTNFSLDVDPQAILPE